MSPEQVAELIQKRRSIYPKTYRPDAPIDKQTIEAILESARWAPTHRMTEPWRFQVFHSEASRKALGTYMADFLQKNTPGVSPEKLKKTLENPLRAGAVIAIIMQRDPEERVPEFEEIAAVSMAVQNMWLHCHALGLGCYWSTPRAMLNADDFLELKPGQRCLGLFYMGHHDMPEIPGQRQPLDGKVEWK